MPVPPLLAQVNMMRFHKPDKMRQILLTGRWKWCIICRMFVFGRSLPFSIGSGTNRKGCKGFGASDGSVWFDAAPQESPHLSARLCCSAGWDLPSPPPRYGGLFLRSCVKTSQYIARVFLRKETVDSLCRGTRVAALPCAVLFSRQPQAHFHGEQKGLPDII